jgi:hypothetical protein
MHVAFLVSSSCFILLRVLRVSLSIAAFSSLNGVDALYMGGKRYGH